jgi:DNA-directed RNA polymerase subunit F
MKETHTTHGESKMTAEQTRRIRNEIAKCTVFIEKEEARNADLRPQEMVELLAFYKKHKAKLEEMVA